MLSRLTTAALFTLLVFTAATAQQTTHTHGIIEHAELAAPSCGTYRMHRFDHAAAVRNTAVASPDLYRQAVAEAKGTSARVMSAEEVLFWAPDYTTMQYVQIRAARVHSGGRARIWVDVRDTALSSVRAKLPVLIKALEDSTSPRSRNPGKGIIENDIEVFGDAPRNVGDGIQDFLLYDISDQSILGFFMPTDQMDDEFSNRRNLLYIDSREGLTRTESLLNTLAHEFQHLLHFGANPDADLFINEGCSEVAGLLCGYVDRLNSSYLRNTNTSLLDFPREGDANLQAYERALTVMHYLYEQFGESFLREVPKVSNYGMTVINQALRMSHPTDPRASWDSVGRDFAVANWVQTSTDPRYGYRVGVTHPSQRRARHLRTYTATSIRNSDSLTLQPYGAAYVVYEAPPVLVLNLKGRYRFAVTAIGYRGDEVEVMTFQQGQPAIIGSPGSATGYDRVVLVFTEQSNASQKITWQVSDGISAIADGGAATTGAAMTVAPNPASERSAITYTLDSDAIVNLALHAPNGEVVRTMINGERVAAGAHHAVLNVSGLPAGAYLARLVANGRVETRVVVVH